MIPRKGISPWIKWGRSWKQRAHGMRLTEIFDLIKRFFGHFQELAEKISVNSIKAR
jgi:hypothetical protein